MLPPRPSPTQKPASSLWLAYGLPGTVQCPLPDSRYPLLSSLSHTARHTLMSHDSTCFAFSPYHEQAMIISGPRGLVVQVGHFHAQSIVPSHYDLNDSSWHFASCSAHRFYFPDLFLPIACPSKSFSSLTVYLSCDILTMPTLVCVLLL